MKKALLLGIALSGSLTLFFCSGSRPPSISPDEKAAFTEAFHRAGHLFEAGHYAGLRQACCDYRKLLDVPEFRKQAGSGFIKTALLLTLREKELGIIRHDFFQEAAALAKGPPAFEALFPYLEIVEHIPDETKGIVGEIAPENPAGDSEDDLDRFFDWVNNRIPVLNEWLKARAASTDFDAYLYISFRSAFSSHFDNDPEPFDAGRFFDIFPESPLLGYLSFISGPIDGKGLRTWLESRPGYTEAHFYLGELELQSGRVLSAERHYLKAFEVFPESTSLAISLSKVYFHSEELERSLEYDDRALDLAPTYRDALLGKAMCLAYLERYEPSLAVLDTMLRLDKYYLGETHYWSAWNFNETDRLDEARAHIDKARHYLIGHSEVSTLDGIISYKQALLDDAELDLLESLRLQPDDCDAAYWLGKVYADKSNWRYSGVYFEKGAECKASQQAAFEARILEIEESDMTPARKNALIQKKKLQILQIRNTRATCQYNAAASFFNSKAYEKALALAEQAATHPNFRQSAAQLIQGIKDRKIYDIKESR